MCVCISLPRDLKSRFVVVLLGSWKALEKPVQGWWVGGRESELEAEYFQSTGSRWLVVPSWAKAIAWFDPSLEMRLSYVRKALCNIQYSACSADGEPGGSWEWGRAIESEAMKLQFC